MLPDELPTAPQIVNSIKLRSEVVRAIDYVRARASEGNPQAAKELRQWFRAAALLLPSDPK